MNTYTYYREPCALCGDELPKRHLNKLMLGEAHSSVPRLKKLCGICDNCLPKLYDFLEVSEPEEPEKRPYKPRQWCRKCGSDVGKTAKFCPYCGDELASQASQKVVPPIVNELPKSAPPGTVVLLDTRI